MNSPEARGPRPESAGSVKSFEDLTAWKKARILARDVYVATRADQFSRDFGLRDQTRRSAVSIMANIAEGFERHRPADYTRFLTIAKASCAELQSHLYVALDIEYLDEESFDKLWAQSREVGRIIGGLIQSVRAWSDERSGLGPRASGP